MHFWKSSNSPSPSPKSLPSSPSKQKRVFRDLAQFWKSSSPDTRQLQQPRLTRQQRLRHVSDIETGDVHHRLAVSANSTPLSQSPPQRQRSRRWLSLMPLPLPPEALLRRGESALASSSSNSVHFSLPSPNDVLCREGEEIDGGVDVTVGDVLNGKTSSMTDGRKLSYRNFFKGGEHVDRSAGSTLGSGNRASQPQELKAVSNIRNNYKLSVPARSAPASGFSSPVRSPRRISCSDYFPHAQISSQSQPHIRSDAIFPSLDMICSPQASPIMASPDHSPLHSPKMRTPSASYLNGAATPMHPKLSMENTAAWHDNNGTVSVYPLPLPPQAMTLQTNLVHQPMAKPESSPLISQWQKTRLIGSGTFGNVYVANNKETGALCAMKEVNIIPDDPKSIESVKQLEQEIHVLSKLKHPNIVQYYGSEIVEDRFYIYLEYVHPGSIIKYIQQHGAMTESVVRNFTRHILSGLAYLHSTKTMHRDIKGANLLVDASGVVKLADFGMAKHLCGEGAHSLRGSPHWMAPEVLHANMMQKDAGYLESVDIWSLGCTIIEMFTGKPPWSQYEGAAAMFKVLRNECPPIPESLSPDGKNFLQRCLQKSPADRPTANQLLEHPFIRNTHHLEINGSIQTFSQINLERTHSPGRWKSLNQASPRASLNKGKQLLNVEAGVSHVGSSESAPALHHSQRSNLKSISAPAYHANIVTHDFIPYPNGTCPRNGQLSLEEVKYRNFLSSSPWKNLSRPVEAKQLTYSLDE